MNDSTPARVDKKDYNRQMQEPRWQRRKPQIHDRDKWRCRFCFDNTIRLHVHHVEYAPGADAWAYPNTELLSLCEDCHWIMQFCAPAKPRTRLSMAMLLRATNRHAAYLLTCKEPCSVVLTEEVSDVPNWKAPDDETT